MSGAKQRVPAIEGWFELDGDEPHLLGQRDVESGTVFFPKDVAVSRAPGFADAKLEEVRLSRTGTLWSYTTNHYQPPEPYVSPDPFVPYTVVLGQLAAGVDPAGLEVGMEMELVLGTLFEDADQEVVVWKWKPVASGEEA
jgi:uncharacterized OB-fold protein